MVSIKDFAADHGITYEAVRQQVKRYETELDGHIFVQGRTQYLDDHAVEFLEAKRAANPVVIYEANKDEEISRLNTENKALLLKLSEKQEKIELLQDRMLELAEAPVQLLTAKSEAAAAHDEAERLRSQLREAEKENENLRQQLTDAQATQESPSDRRWWQFWK